MLGVEEHLFQGIFFQHIVGIDCLDPVQHELLAYGLFGIIFY